MLPMQLVGMGLLLFLAGVSCGMLTTKWLWGQSVWSLNHSKSVMDEAVTRRMETMIREESLVSEGGAVAKQLALLTTASEKLEKAVAHLWLESQGSGRSLRGPKETQRGEEDILPFPAGTQRAHLPQTEPVKDGFEQKPIDRPGVVKNRHEPARGEHS